MEARAPPRGNVWILALELLAVTKDLVEKSCDKLPKQSLLDSWLSCMNGRPFITFLIRCLQTHEQ